MKKKKVPKKNPGKSVKDINKKFMFEPNTIEKTVNDFDFEPSNPSMLAHTDKDSFDKPQKLVYKDEWPVENRMPPKQWIITELQSQSELDYIRQMLVQETWGGLPINSYLRSKLPFELISLINYHQMKTTNRLMVLVLHDNDGKLSGFAIFAFGQPHPQRINETATVIVCWKASEISAEIRLLQTIVLLYKEFKTNNPDENSIIFVTKDANALAQFKNVSYATTISATAEAKP